MDANETRARETASSGEALVDLARSVALELHHGGRDKGGRPYAAHLARVAHALRTPEAQAVGWLHDVIEDTGTTEQDLVAMGFPEPVVRAVSTLTHRQQYGYEHYIDGIVESGDLLALAVKFADVRDHLQPFRVGQVSVAQGIRYATAQRRLWGRQHLFAHLLAFDVEGL